MKKILKEYETARNCIVIDATGTGKFTFLNEILNQTSFLTEFHIKRKKNGGPR